MKLTKLWQTGPINCHGGNCPTLYRATNDDGVAGYVVKGWTLSPDDLAAVAPDGDETGVFVPADVIDRIREG